MNLLLLIDITIATIPNKYSHCFVNIHNVKNDNDSNIIIIVNEVPQITIHINVINEIRDDISNILHKIRYKYDIDIHLISENITNNFISIIIFTV